MKTSPLFKKKGVEKSRMIHSQDSRMACSQGDFKLSEESRSSGVSALVSRLNSSTSKADHAGKSRGEPSRTMEQKMQDTFPWIPSFSSLCQASVGCRNVKALESLMKKYIENVTPSVKDCYSKANRASKLKKNMKDILIFFHLFYQEVKESLERSSYLDLMTPLVSMLMDMEIKASISGKESFKKKASRLTSSLYLFLDNSEEHMLDAVLMTKYITKTYQGICHPLLWKLLNNISNRKDDIFYVRYLLTFKLWKKINPDSEERKRINKAAVQKLHAPPNLLENVKALGNVLPRIPKTKKNITLFLMQSNFNLKDACQEFLKSVKKTQKTVYNQSVGNLDIDKPLFLMSDSASGAHLLSEKNVEVESGHKAVDTWSSISMQSIASPSDIVKELKSDKVMGTVMTLGSKKKSKVGKKKKKGKKKLKGTKAKKKKKQKNNASGVAKGSKKAGKLKAKKKKKLRQLEESIKQSVPQICENNQNKIKQISSQAVEPNQPAVKSPLPVLKEEPEQTKVKPTVTMHGQGSKVNVKVDLAQLEESVPAKVAQAVTQILEESKNKKAVEEPIICDLDTKSKSLPEDDYEQVVKHALLLANDQIKVEKMKNLDIAKTEKDQSVCSLESSKSDLFSDKQKEVEIQVEQPKTEKVDAPLSSSKLFDTTISVEVDETMIKKEKADVVSTVCVASQCDLSGRALTEVKEQVVEPQASCSISTEKKEIMDAQYKPDKLTDASELPADDSSVMITKPKKCLIPRTASDFLGWDCACSKALSRITKVSNYETSSNWKSQSDSFSEEGVQNLKSAPDKLLEGSESGWMSPSKELSKKMESQKNSKHDYVSTVCVASQCNLNERSLSEIKVQVDEPQLNSSISSEKKVIMDTECKPNKLNEETILPVDDLSNTCSSKNLTDSTFDVLVTNSLIVEKTKEKSSEGESDLNLPKTEEFAISPSSLKLLSTPACEINISSKLEEAHINSFEKKVSETLVYAKPSLLTGETVLSSDDLVSKHDIKEKTDIFDNQSPHLFAVEKPRDENLYIPISHVIDESKINSYEKTKLSENAVPVSMYSEDMEICNSSMKDVCASSEASKISIVAKVNPMNTSSVEEILEEQQETGNCNTIPLEEELALSDDAERSYGNFLNTGNSYVFHYLLEDNNGQQSYIVSQNVSCDSTILPFEEHDRLPGYDPERDIAGFHVPRSDFYSETIKDDSNYNNPYEIEWMSSGDLPPPERPLLNPSYAEEEDESSPKSYDSSTPKRGMGKMSYSDIISQEKQKQSHSFPNSSESGASGSCSPRSESGTDSGEFVQDTIEDYGKVVKTVRLCERVSDESSLRYNNCLCDNSDEMESSMATKVSSVSTNSEGDTLEDHQDTGNCTTSSIKECVQQVPENNQRCEISGSSSPHCESDKDFGGVGKDAFSCSTMPYTHSTLTSSMSPNSFHNRSSGVMPRQRHPQPKSASDFSGWEAYTHLSKPSSYRTNDWKPPSETFSVESEQNLKSISDKSLESTEGEWKSQNEVLSKKPGENIKYTMFDHVNQSESLETKKKPCSKLVHGVRRGSQGASNKQLSGELPVAQAGAQILNIPSNTSGAITHETTQKQDESKERCYCAECSDSSRKVSASSFSSTREGPPSKKPKTSKSHHDDAVGSQMREKQGSGELSLGQGRASVRGQRRRGRPPGRGRGVSSSSKMSSDSKSTRKPGSSQKGKNNREYQVTNPKKSQEYDPPITRSATKKCGISDPNMFDRL